MVSKDLIRQKMELYIRLLNAGDVEGIIALYADDAVVEKTLRLSVSVLQRGKH